MVRGTAHKPCWTGLELTLLNALVRGVLFRVCFFFFAVIDVGGEVWDVFGRSVSYKLFNNNKCF